MKMHCYFLLNIKHGGLTVVFGGGGGAPTLCFARAAVVAVVYSQLSALLTFHIMECCILREIERLTAGQTNSEIVIIPNDTMQVYVEDTL